MWLIKTTHSLTLSQGKKHDASSKTHKENGNLIVNHHRHIQANNLVVESKGVKEIYAEGSF
jgi:hypothetical protein